VFFFCACGLSAHLFHSSPSLMMPLSRRVLPIHLAVVLLGSKQKRCVLIRVHSGKSDDTKTTRDRG